MEVVAESAVNTPTFSPNMEHAAEKTLYDEILKTSVKLIDKKKGALVVNDRNICAEYLQTCHRITVERGIKILEFRDCEFNCNSVAETLVTLIDRGIETLVLSGSEISREHLQHIGENMLEENESLTEIDLSHIELDEVGVKAVSKICNKTKRLDKLNLHDCELDGELLNILSEADKRTKPVSVLTLSSNPDISKSVEDIATIVEKFGCKEIDISTNSLDGTHITRLTSKAAPRNLTTIHVRENPIDKWELLGQLVRKWGIKKLDVSHCVMYLKDVQKFIMELGDHQLDVHFYHPHRRKPLSDLLCEALRASKCTIS